MQEITTGPLLVLDNIRSLANVGSIFRTADSLGAGGLILCGITGCPPHREIQKTALGATENVPWKHFADSRQAIEWLADQQYHMLAIEQTDKSMLLQEITAPFTSKDAFVFGNEVNGVSDDFLKAARGCIELPQLGLKQSMNVSVCAGIVLWEYFRRAQ